MLDIKQFWFVKEFAVKILQYLRQFWRYKDGRPYFENIKTGVFDIRCLSWITAIIVFEDDVKIVAEFPSLLGHPVEDFFLHCWSLWAKWSISSHKLALSERKSVHYNCTFCNEADIIILSWISNILKLFFICIMSNFNNFLYCHVA